MTNRTALFSRHQPGGVFTVDDYKEHPANIWWVDSDNGTDATGYGGNPDIPVASIDYAFGLCGEGDKVYVQPWHEENLITATAINADVAGVTVEGLKWGNLMPTLSMTAAAGAITVAAANVTLKNLKLVANFATGVTQGIAVAATGDGCTLDGIVCRDTTTDKEFLVHINVATTVDDLTIRNCSLVGLTGGSMTNSILFAGTSTNALIEDNYIFVDSSDDVIDHLAAASVNLVVRRNVIINADTDAAGYCLRYKSDGTGAAYHNLMAYNKDNAEISIGAAAWWFENYASNTIAESGRLDPTTAHAIP